MIQEKYEQDEFFQAQNIPDLECLNVMRAELVKYECLHVSFFVNKYGWSERKVKSIASVSGGEILSWDGGYMLTCKASLDVVNKSYNRLAAQAKSTMQRAEGIRKFSHHVIG